MDKTAVPRECSSYKNEDCDQNATNCGLLLLSIAPTLYGPWAAAQTANRFFDVVFIYIYRVRTISVPGLSYRGGHITVSLPTLCRTGSESD